MTILRRVSQLKEDVENVSAGKNCLMDISLDDFNEETAIQYSHNGNSYPEMLKLDKEGYIIIAHLKGCGHYCRKLYRLLKEFLEEEFHEYEILQFTKHDYNDIPDIYKWIYDIEICFVLKIDPLSQF